MEGKSAMYEFVGIGELAETTTHLLSLTLQQNPHTPGKQRSQLDRVERLVLQQASDYLRKVREGFMLSVRASQVNSPSEIHYLLDRVLTDWAQLSRELGLDDTTAPESTDDSSDALAQMPKEHPERVRYQLLAFGMATIALGHLPRLPAQLITFPHSHSNPPTYADIPVPSTPGEMLWRIEEIEQTVWRIMSNDLRELVGRRYGPLRRTYGFFETSAYLSRKESKRFGIKKRRSDLSFF